MSNNSVVHGKGKSMIWRLFIEEFGEILESECPKEEEINQLFEWLKDEAHSALSFRQIKTIDECRRYSEARLLKFYSPKNKLWKKSREARREQANRFDELRTTKKIVKGRLSVIQGHKEEEKVLPSN
jgi:hypothetical protein